MKLARHQLDKRRHEPLMKLTVIGGNAVAELLCRFALLYYIPEVCRKDIQ